MCVATVVCAVALPGMVIAVATVRANAAMVVAGEAMVADVAVANDSACGGVRRRPWRASCQRRRWWGERQ